MRVYPWELDAQLTFSLVGRRLTIDFDIQQETRLSRGPGLRPIHLSWSPEFKVMVVWTLKGKDFLCVEPWTAAAGALATGEGLPHVQPDERLSLAFDIEV